MRLRSDIWVHAYIRARASAGCPAFVVRHGDDAAGAIFVKINHLDGTASVYGPAPAGFSETSLARRFSTIVDAGGQPERDIDTRLAEQYAFDPDMWLIEVEDAKKRHFLEDWLDADRAGS